MPEPSPFGRIASSFAAGFRALGVRLDVVLVREHKHSTFDGLVRWTGLGVRARSAFPYLLTYLRRTRPKAVVVTPLFAPIAILAGRLTGIPVIPWEISFLELDAIQPNTSRRGRLLPPALRFTYRWAAALAGVSHDVVAYAAAAHSGFAGKPLFDLPNPIDLDALARQAAAAPAFTPSVAGFSLCASGRLTGQKGFDLLIAALARRRDDLPPDWRLTILGEGEWRDRLKRQAREAGLEDRVGLPGLVHNPFPVVSRADLFVHPARWEGFGMVLLEALALGVPALATDCPGGPHEILDGGRAGRIVRSEDADALGDALVELSADEGERRRLASAGLKRAEDYSAPRIAERLRSVAKAVWY